MRTNKKLNSVALAALILFLNRFVYAIGSYCAARRRTTYSHIGPDQQHSI